VDSAGNIENGQVEKMAHQQDGQTNGTSLFAGAIPCRISGQHGFALRVMPKHADLVEPYEPGMILWESAENS
jgi:starch phosphorylase